MRALHSLASSLTRTYQVADCRTCGQVAAVAPPVWRPPCRCTRPRPRLLSRRAQPADLAHYPLYALTAPDQEGF